MSVTGEISLHLSAFWKHLDSLFFVSMCGFFCLFVFFLNVHPAEREKANHRRTNEKTNTKTKQQQQQTIESAKKKENKRKKSRLRFLKQPLYTVLALKEEGEQI